MNTKSFGFSCKKPFLLETGHDSKSTFIQPFDSSPFFISHPTMLTPLNDNFSELNFGDFVFEMINFSVTVISQSAFRLLFVTAFTQSGTE